ncbi:MAG: adenosine deaminase, partial [bacterium]
MNFAPLPKIELHLHLDCSLSFEIVSRLNPSISLEKYQNDFIAPAKCTNLADLLTRAPKGIQLMQTEYELRLVTTDMFQQLQRDGVIYAEIRFAPLFHTEKGLSPEQVVEIAESATAQASESTGIEARLILCTLRHFSEEQSLQTAQLVKRFKGTRVAALDIAGDEAGFGIDKHRAAFQFAIDHNLPRIAHAGEANGPDSVWETLKYFQPSRIGHGVRSIEEPDLLAHLKQQNIHL